MLKVLYSGTQLKQISDQRQPCGNLIETVIGVELLSETKFEDGPCFFSREVLNIENHFALVRIKSVSIPKSSKSIQN